VAGPRNLKQNSDDFLNPAPRNLGMDLSHWRGRYPTHGSSRHVFNGMHEALPIGGMTGCTNPKWVWPNIEQASSTPGLLQTPGSVDMPHPNQFPMILPMIPRPRSDSRYTHIQLYPFTTHIHLNPSLVAAPPNRTKLVKSAPLENE
jgi:hypothetical protein